MIWFRTRARFLFVEQSSDAGAPPSLSQLSSALALLFGRFGCFSGMIAICIEFQGVSRPTEVCCSKLQFIGPPVPMRPRCIGWGVIGLACVAQVRQSGHSASHAIGTCQVKPDLV